MLMIMKPIPHPSRRFSAGDHVAEADLAGCSIELRDLRARGFVSGGSATVTVTADAGGPGNAEIERRVEQAIAARGGRRR